MEEKGCWKRRGFQQLFSFFIKMNHSDASIWYPVLDSSERCRKWDMKPVKKNKSPPGRILFKIYDNFS